MFLIPNSDFLIKRLITCYSEKVAGKKGEWKFSSVLLQRFHGSKRDKLMKKLTRSKSSLYFEFSLYIPGVLLSSKSFKRFFSCTRVSLHVGFWSGTVRFVSSEEKKCMINNLKASRVYNGVYNLMELMEFTI